MVNRMWEIHSYDPQKKEWTVQPVHGDETTIREYAAQLQAEHPRWGIKVCKPEAKCVPLAGRNSGIGSPQSAPRATMAEPSTDPTANPSQPAFVIIRRRYAVWLEDAFQVARPPDDELAEYDGDLQAWAAANIDDVYSQVFVRDQRRRSGLAAHRGARLLWEDEHKADLDFPESEVTVEPWTADPSPEG